MGTASYGFWVLVDDARIFVWLDQPERVDREIARFLKALSPRGAQPSN